MWALVSTFLLKTCYVSSLIRGGVPRRALCGSEKRGYTVVQGSLAASIVKESFEGYGVYDVVFPAVKLGQSALTSFTASFALQENPVEVVLVEATVSVTEKPAGFRVTCNNVTITREFRPAYCIETEGGERLCKLLYDITPIIKSKRANTADIVIENYGISGISLHELALIVLYGSPGAHVAVKHYSGVVLLEPGEFIQLEAPGSGKLEAHIVAYLPHSDSRLLVNERELPGHGYGLYKVELGAAGRVEIGYRGRADVYPRKAAVVGVLVTRGNVPRPHIDVEAKRISDEEVQLLICNNGAADAENVIVVSLSKGLVIERKILGRLAAGDSREVHVHTSDSPTVIRVIWRELGELRMQEVRV